MDEQPRTPMSKETAYTVVKASTGIALAAAWWPVAIPVVALRCHQDPAFRAEAVKAKDELKEALGIVAADLKDKYIAPRFGF